ncbi:TPA: 3-phosphoshikimate 1-carboxyvinyltransferase [Candidatus Latescibacteria bacterium]|nr:3-phosphoshikimate 1-carboxyvinyltransferase [Candidatus Latescibacterota bacterium]
METLELQPFQRPVDAEVEIPGSKSYTNRALLIAALADGETVVEGALFSDDTNYMAKSLRRLGIDVVEDQANARFTVQGCGGKIPASSAELFVGNSGTTARFLTAFVSLGKGEYVIDGSERMRERPIQDLLDGLEALGVDAKSEAGNGCPPIRIKANGIRGGRTFVPGDRSSQYFTALLLSVPYAREDVEVRVVGDLVSKPYLDMTADIMRHFGVDTRNDSYNTFSVQAGLRYRAQPYHIEPDATNATYFFGAAALTGGKVRVQHLTRESAQGDVRFVEVLEKMGCGIADVDGGIEVTGPEHLSRIDIDLNDMPDTMPTLCALAPFADGPVTIRNVAVLRLHETDRIAAMETELTKLGISLRTWADGIEIQPADTIIPAEVDTYDDHRMAMSLALIGLRAPGVVIRDPECVNKTFPTFFDTLARIQPD